MACRHKKLTYEPSPHAAVIGWPRRTAKQLYKATGEEAGRACQPDTSRGSREEDQRHLAARRDEDPSYGGSFPAPLILPGDELAYDPKYPAQSYRSWLNEKHRNTVEKVYGGRNVVYVVAPPKIEEDLKGAMKEWARPKLSRKKSNKSSQSTGETPHPKMKDVVDYLAAFYHGVPVKTWPQGNEAGLSFGKWEDDETEEASPQKRKRSGSRSNKPAKPTKDIPSAIALKTSTEAIRLRVRQRRNDIYNVQLNLNDLLDVAHEILPSDAYAILMLVEQDLYEDDDDDFACGRAYGGSRVCVVSMARYNPDADAAQDIDREHAWPASHCKAFVEAALDIASDDPKKPSRKPNADEMPDEFEEIDDGISCCPTPLQCAVSKYLHAQTVAERTDRQCSEQTLWLGRVCRTASHELGHCFGIDHCVYYACVMQGTASIQEDGGQPPYLCPVDLAKLRHATGADMDERYARLMDFCIEHGGGTFFEPFAAWIGARRAEVTGQILGTGILPSEGEEMEVEGGKDDEDNEKEEVEVVDLTTPPRKSARGKRRA